MIVLNINIVIRSVKMVIRMLKVLIIIIEVRYQFNWINKVSPTWDALRSCFFILQL